MSLKCGIIGLTSCGKTTLFNCVSNSKIDPEQNYGKSNLGQINVPDDRLYKISEYIKTEKIIHTTVDLVDIPGLSKGSGQAESSSAKFLAEIQQTDALIHVIRCFDSQTVPHAEGSVNPIRDKEIVDLELCVRDLSLVERKIERMEKLIKVGNKEAKHTIETLLKYKDHLENFMPARTIDLSDEEKKAVADIMLITSKPVIYVCNVDSDSAKNGNSYSDSIVELAKAESAEVLIIAADLEADIAMLDDPEDRKEFLNDAGLTEPGVNRLVRAAYNILDLQSFFTAGPKEIRAWTIKKGTTAPQAAGVIHSDLERGFIRAEVMKYEDFITLKSEHACREAGKLSVEGKNYVVNDGDIIHIRFNV
ncbi:MAG: redox-regulated ATPase YchF [Bacteroidales bacterium]|jgi:GTP-binding protein YchF